MAEATVRGFKIGFGMGTIFGFIIMATIIAVAKAVL